MTLTVSAVVPALASALVSIVWQSILLVICAEVCARLIPGLSAKLRSFLWLGALLTVLLLPLAPLLRSGFQGSAPQLRLEPFWAMVLVLGWAALSMLSAARLLHSAMHLYRVAAGAQAVTPGPEVAPLLSEAKVELCTSAAVDVPSVAGFFRPRILLPPALFAEVTPADLRRIVLHELEHLRRHDDWINLLQKLVLVLFPLNPALLWVERRLCLERELACDDGVLRADGAGAKAYATCLVNLAERGLLRRGLSLALGAWRRRSELSRRVQRILRQAQSPSPRPAHPAGVAVCLIAIVTGTAVVSVRAPQLVGFGGVPAAVVAQGPEASAQSSSRVGSSFHSTLVKASIPLESRSSIAPAGLARTHAQARLRRSVRVRGSARQPSPGVVLIGWRPGGSSAPRAVYTRGTWTLTAYPTFTYAAVPTGSGWLFIQL